jgi:NAD(P)-dependent dehydrogenase (short-subunit alcohol dehydrogenase family)
MVGWFYSIVDHLVNNAGMARLRLFEEVKQFSDMASVMVTNLHLIMSYFWNKLEFMLGTQLFLQYFSLWSNITFL